MACAPAGICPALEGGDGALADSAALGLVPVDGLLLAGQSWPVTAGLERRAGAATGALVRLAGGGHHVGAGQRVVQAVGAGGGQVVHSAGQGRRGPDEASLAVGDDLHVDSVALVLGVRGEQVDGFSDVPPDRGDADREAAGQSSDGVTVTQMGQGEQGLPASRRRHRPRRRVRSARMRSARWFRVRLDSATADG